ncbi:MAG: DUF5666 domain-containing protein [Ktedonobacterales bacterium]
MSEFHDDPTVEGSMTSTNPEETCGNVPPFSRDDAGGIEYTPLRGNGRHRMPARVRRSLVAGGLVATLGIGAVGGGALALAHANSNAGGASGIVGATTLAQGKGHPGHGRFGPPAPLTVTAVSGSVISATQPNGTKVTIHTTSSTTYTRAGKTVSASALTSNEHIRVRGTRASDGSITATHIDIALPGYAGVVTAMKGNTITVKDRSGTTHTIDVSTSTTYAQGRGPNAQSASLSAVKVGEQIVAEGTLNSDGSLNAQVVHIGPARPAGTPKGKGVPPAPGTSPAKMPQGAPQAPGAAPTGL